MHDFIIILFSFMIGERKVQYFCVTVYRKLTVAKQAEICTSHLGVIFKINMWFLPLSSVLTCATLSREERILYQLLS